MPDEKELYFKLFGRVADLRDMLSEILLESTSKARKTLRNKKSAAAR